jgi:bifunctional DNA-binding transcriptional regulator/antitoxin component of YhaV-PrlF toxin-antitoxin module
MTNGTNADKPDGPPSKEEMHQIDTSTAKESDKREVGDGLRLQVSVPKWARDAMKTEGGDKIWTKAVSNGHETDYKAKLHSNGRTFVLPKDKRQELSLSPQDEVQFWVSKFEGKAGDEKQGNNKSDSSAGDETVEQESEQETLIRFDPPIDAYYHIRDGNETVCGESLSERGIKEITDPGDALAPCPKCNVKSPDKMSNEQIVAHLAEKAGFEYNSNNPSYFSKGELVALLKYVVELEDE